MDPSLSKLASDVVSDSSTSPNGSSPTDTPDRNDPSNSSPNPSYGDGEIQAALRSEEYHLLFRLPPEEKIIAFNEITSVKRAKTGGIFPKAVEISPGERKYFFASFLSRDEAFKLINDGWLQHGNGAREITEQRVS